MQDRDTGHIPITITRRRLLFGVAATVIAGVAGGFSRPQVASARTIEDAGGASYEATVSTDDPASDGIYQETEDGFEGDLTDLEPLDSSAVVVEEDSETGFLKFNLGADPNCRTQFRATANRFQINPAHAGRVSGPKGEPRYNHPVPGDSAKPGDFLEPIPNRTYQATGFVDRVKRLMGVSTANGRGDILFTADPGKQPARVVEFKGRSNEANQMPITVARVGGAARAALVPCGWLKPFPFYSFFK